MKRWLPFLLLATLGASSAASAQHATRDTVAAQQLRTLADSLEARASTAYRVDTTRLVDTLHLVDTVRLVRVDTVKLVRVDTVVVVVKDSVPGPVSDSIPTPVPVPVVTTVGPAKVATLPPALTAVPYPRIGRSVRVPLIANLQSYLDNAIAGDVLLLPPGATYTGNFTLRNRSGPDSSAVIVRTDTSINIVGRMTPTLGVQLAKLISPNQLPALVTMPAAHDWRITGLELAPIASLTADVNMIIRIGDATTHANVPRRIILDRLYVHGQPALNVTRCIVLNGAESQLLDSWVTHCHSNNKHSQAVLGYSGTENVLIENNELHAGHEVVAFGGADNVDDSYTPRRIVVRRNHITRPVTWQRPINPASPPNRMDSPGTWQEANLLETKNVRELLIEGNIFENNWADVQDGAAIVLKSENQTGAAPWSQTADVTIRYNVLRCVAKAFRFNGYGSNANLGVVSTRAARLTVTDNLVDQLNVAPCNGADGTPIQVQSGVDAVIFTHNTITNPAATGYGVLFTQGPMPTFAMHSNLYGRGGYGALRTGGVTEGTASLTNQVTSWLYQNNVVIGSVSCSLYPATTTCSSSVPATLPASYDTRPIGADVARVKALTAGVVVAP